MALALTAAPCGGLAGPRIVVELTDGEQVTAEVDGRTSADRLWLRLTAGNAEILRPIAWEKIARGVVGSDEFAGPAFRDKALQLRSLPDAPPGRPRRGNLAERKSPLTARPPVAIAEEIWLGTRRVASIWADAHLGHWDAGADPNGLLLRVVPLDCRGAPVAVAGTLEAELWDDRSRYPRRLGRWTCSVSSAEAAWATSVSNHAPWPGFVQRLEFQADDPVRDATISRTGALHVSFAVAGHGVFEYRVKHVVLRP